MNLPYHGKYEWLPLLYDIIKDFNPKKIIEFGPGKGFTTITMALALKELKSGTIIDSYDIWDEDYWGDKDNCIRFFDEWGVNQFINLEHLNFYDWGIKFDYPKSELLEKRTVSLPMNENLTEDEMKYIIEKVWENI